MRIYAILLAAVVLAGCEKAVDVYYQATCPDEMLGAVLDKLGLGAIRGLGNKYNTKTAQEQATKRMLEINKIREWARTLKEPCIKTYYMRWMNHAERNVMRQVEFAESWQRKFDLAPTIPAPSGLVR